MLSENYKLSEGMIKALNEQVEMEFYSSFLYLSAANFFAVNGLKGCACLFESQSKEKHAHGLKFVSLFKKYRLSPSFNFSFEIPVWTDYESVFRQSLEHEKKVSTSIRKIYELAEAENDIFVCEFLGWFVKEQLEEENRVIDLNKLYQQYSRKQAGLNDMDRLLEIRCEKERKNDH